MKKYRAMTDPQAFEERLREATIELTRWVDQNSGNIDLEAYRRFVNFIQSERRLLIEDIIELSDEIEIRNEDGFQQWKGFKALRNTLRDRYLEEKSDE